MLQCDIGAQKIQIKILVPLLPLPNLLFDMAMLTFAIFVFLRKKKQNKVFCFKERNENEGKGRRNANEALLAKLQYLIPREADVIFEDVITDQVNVDGIFKSINAKFRES